MNRLERQRIRLVIVQATRTEHTHGILERTEQLEVTVHADPLPKVGWTQAVLIADAKRGQLLVANGATHGFFVDAQDLRNFAGAVDDAHSSILAHRSIFTYSQEVGLERFGMGDSRAQLWDCTNHCGDEGLETTELQDKVESLRKN
jgi:hypothetical protein